MLIEQKIYQGFFTVTDKSHNRWMYQFRCQKGLKMSLFSILNYNVNISQTICTTFNGSGMYIKIKRHKKGEWIYNEVVQNS